MSESTGPTSAKRVAGEDAAAPTAKQPRSGRIVVNVGGKCFTTTVQTLTNGGHGYFAALLGVTGSALGGAEDELFVDRSAELFEYVLHWLRTHTLPAALKSNAHLLADAMNEAEFFGLDDMVSACQEAVPPGPRSFSLKVCGRLFDPDGEDEADDAHLSHSNKAACWCGEVFKSDGMPKLNPGEVTYIHSAVLTGEHIRLKRKNHDWSGDYATAGCYLHSGRKCFDGDFQLQYMRTEHYNAIMGAMDNNDDFDVDNVFVLAHRGLDDAQKNAATHLHDINFREVLDLVIDGPVLLRSVGIGDWHVHGWVGRLEDIPRTPRP